MRQYLIQDKDEQKVVLQRVLGIYRSEGKQMTEKKKYKLKITCYTPKGKAEKSSKSFAMRHFDSLNTPVETKVVSDSEFYYIYEYDKIAKMERAMNKKVPKAVSTIRSFYLIVIHATRKANKLGKQGAWALERTKRFILKTIRKKMKDKERELDDFIDGINMEDEEEILALLSGPVIEYEILEGE